MFVYLPCSLNYTHITDTYRCRCRRVCSGRCRPFVLCRLVCCLPCLCYARMHSLFVLATLTIEGIGHTSVYVWCFFFLYMRRKIVNNMQTHSYMLIFGHCLFVSCIKAFTISQITVAQQQHYAACCGCRRKRVYSIQIYQCCTKT